MIENQLERSDHDPPGQGDHLHGDDGCVRCHLDRLGAEAGARARNLPGSTARRRSGGSQARVQFVSSPSFVGRVEVTLT